MNKIIHFITFIFSWISVIYFGFEAVSKGNTELYYVVIVLIAMFINSAIGAICIGKNSK